MKFCKDCVWWFPNTSTSNRENLDICKEPSLQKPKGISMVTGEPIPPSIVWAENERKYGTCGEEAKLFQSRETQLQVAPEQVQV